MRRDAKLHTAGVETNATVLAKYYHGGYDSEGRDDRTCYLTLAYQDQQGSRYERDLQVGRDTYDSHAVGGLILVYYLPTDPTTVDLASDVGRVSPRWTPNAWDAATPNAIGQAAPYLLPVDFEVVFSAGVRARFEPLQAMGDLSDAVRAPYQKEPDAATGWSESKSQFSLRFQGTQVQVVASSAGGLTVKLPEEHEDAGLSSPGQSRV